jgi:AraC-like DNA-binding protein
MEALVRARSLAGFEDCVRSLGGDAGSILRLVGLPERILKDPLHWISFKACLGAFQLAGYTLKEPAFGVKLNGFRDFTYMGPLFLTAQHSETIRAALNTVSRYLGIQNTGYHTALSVGAKTCARSYHMSPQLRGIADQWIEESLLGTRNFIAQIANSKVPVVHVTVRHRALRSAESYASAYGAPVLFEQETDSVVIEREFMEQPIPNRDPNIQKFITEYLDQRVLPAGGEVVSATRGLLETFIPMGQAKIENVAHHLTVHPRTLQRRLSESGWSFSQLLEEQRRLMAERLLREGNLPLSNIASFLGYSDQSAFNHAFERWHGTSPSRWNRRSV